MDAKTTPKSESFQLPLAAAIVRIAVPLTPIAVVSSLATTIVAVSALPALVPSTAVVAVAVVVAVPRRFSGSYLSP